jgi:hypothetical protein
MRLRSAWSWIRGSACVALAAATAVAACSSDEEAPKPAETPDATAPPRLGDPCDTYTALGEACDVPPTVRCFPLCETGGCFCRSGASGRVWVCENDFSCFPDAAPDFDGAPVGPIDEPDAATDGDVGTTDASDAADGPSEAGASDAADDADDAS